MLASTTHHSRGQPADDAIALGEIAGGGVRRRRVFGHDGATGRNNVVRESTVTRRINAAMPAPHYRDRRRADVDRSTMRRAIDTDSQAADDD